jgi:hypothetical protein
MDQQFSSINSEDEEPPLSDTVLQVYEVPSMLQYISYHLLDDNEPESPSLDFSPLEQTLVEPQFGVPYPTLANRDFELSLLHRWLDVSVAIGSNTEDETADLLLYLKECEHDDEPSTLPPDRVYFTETLDNYRG